MEDFPQKNFGTDAQFEKEREYPPNPFLMIIIGYPGGYGRELMDNLLTRFTKMSTLVVWYIRLNSKYTKAEFITFDQIDNIREFNCNKSLMNIESLMFAFSCFLNQKIIIR